MGVKSEYAGIMSSEASIEKQTFWQTIRSYGPGIAVVLTWMGAGDLVDSSIAGSHFGYALMWALALSMIIRFVIVNIIARFDLCNTERITIIERFAKLNKFYPYFLMIAPILMGHLNNSYMIKGAGEVLYWLFNFGSPLMWSVVVVISSLFLIGRDAYNKMEVVMKVLLGIMTFTFLALAAYSTPDASEIVKGTIGFALPKNTGTYDTLMVAMSLVGAVAGALGNFFYTYFIREKGWTTPAHKRVQRNDLLFGTCMGIVLVLAIWVVGAEVLKPNNIEVTSLYNISQALEIHLGPVGSVIFYYGAFGVLYSSVIGHAVGYPKISIECLHIIDSERKEKYGTIDNDPLYKWGSLFILISPIIWSLPNMPGFVTLVVGINALNVVILPAIAIGLLIISNQKKYLGKYTNNMLENVVLASTTVLAVWSAIKILMSFFS